MAVGKPVMKVMKKMELILDGAEVLVLCDLLTALRQVLWLILGGGGLSKTIRS